MPIEPRIEKKKSDDGASSEKLVVEFSNGSLEQLRELADFFNLKDSNPSTAIEMGIGLLDKIREKMKKDGINSLDDVES